ncbi:hypothetical protein ABZV78_14420 [Micromonospora sp. NPDC004540]|uniref:hypothetical protein n=1 Tax=Micromonospora sp. NPDC004540 TaxID=3154457 RepID=UPI0033A10B4E
MRTALIVLAALAAAVVVDLLVGALYYALPSGPAEWQRYLRHAILLVLIALSPWLVIKALSVEAIAFSRLPSNVVTSRRIRRARTQIRPVRRLTVAVVTLAAIGLILMTFRPVRLFGISILTSAGVGRRGDRPLRPNRARQRVRRHPGRLRRRDARRRRAGGGWRMGPGRGGEADQRGDPALGRPGTHPADHVLH